MKMPHSLPRLKGYRFPREIVAYAVWAYHRFALSTGDVEDLLAERGVTVLLVEQDVNESLGISDRGYVMEQGQVVLEGSGQELLQNPHVKKAHLGI